MCKRTGWVLAISFRLMGCKDAKPEEEMAVVRARLARASSLRESAVACDHGPSELQTELNESVEAERREIPMFREQNRLLEDLVAKAIASKLPAHRDAASWPDLAKKKPKEGA